jgi:predicted house-cleaning NTP pyrophosphatase (Maf/HAM1 superfamily)
MTSIILASTSPTRSKILESLRLAFRALPPSFDELSSISESPDERAIEAYVEAERPLGCAGSFMAEAAGWRLIENTDGRDVRVLYGLPVIALFDYVETQRIELAYTAAERE